MARVNDVGQSNVHFIIIKVWEDRLRAIQKSKLKVHNMLCNIEKRVLVIHFKGGGLWCDMILMFTKPDSTVIISQYCKGD